MRKEKPLTESRFTSIIGRIITPSSHRIAFSNEAGREYTKGLSTLKNRPISRVVLLVMITILALAGFTGCAEPPENDTNPPPKSIITLSYWVRASQAEQAQTLAKMYNADHETQVSVNVVPDANFIQSFGAAVATGNAPDIISIDLVYLPLFTASNLMTDITELAQKLPYFDKLSQSHIRLATYDKKLYALPLTAEGSFLLYNKKLFRQAGLDPNKPPTNWTEVENYARKITESGSGIKGFYFPGNCAGCNAFTFLPLIWASGGNVLSADGKTASIDTPAVKEALQFYHKLWQEEQIPAKAKNDNGNDLLSAFATDKIGMMGSGSFAISALKNSYPQIDFGVSALPGKNGGTSSFTGGNSIGIAQGSKHVAEAFNFINWTLSPAAQVKVFAERGALPVRTDLAKNEYSQLDSRYEIVSQAIAQGQTPYSVRYDALFNDADGPWIAAIQQAVFEGEVDEAVKSAQQRFTRILTHAHI